MGDVGGGNLPRILHDSFPAEVMVAHGCATHDFNLVSEAECLKIVDALRESAEGLEYSQAAGRSCRVRVGSVQLLCQRFGPSILLVSTRAPERTEDLEFGIGSTIMAEGHRYYPNVAFVDAHNSMTDVTSPVHHATRTATEYIAAAKQAFETCRNENLHPLSIGSAHIAVPFTRDQGFGDLGIQVLVIGTGGQLTGYLLADGNNMAQGMRDILRNRMLTYVDEAEVMTTDSHVVNTVSGKNPIGGKVSADEILRHVDRAMKKAIADMKPAEVAASTACCQRIVVFGSQRVTQLAATVNTILIFIAPLSLAILLLAFLLSIIAFIVIG